MKVKSHCARKYSYLCAVPSALLRVLVSNFSLIFVAKKRKVT